MMQLDTPNHNVLPVLSVTGVTALANAIPGMRALLSLDVSSNPLRVEGTKLLAKVLESNQTMTSLNISSNSMTYDGKKDGNMSGVAALADVIPGMGALTSLNLAGNLIGGYWDASRQEMLAILEGTLCGHSEI
jgi:hypothetical protein